MKREIRGSIERGVEEDRCDRWTIDVETGLQLCLYCVINDSIEREFYVRFVSTFVLKVSDDRKIRERRRIE